MTTILSTPIRTAFAAAVRPLLFTFLLLSAFACSKDSDPETTETTDPGPVFTAFTELGELNLPVTDASKFTARSIRVKGDTLFVANNHADDRSIYLFNRNSMQLLGKISSWTRSGTTEQFDAEIGDMAVSDKFIFVGMYNSRINIFERKSLKFVNAIGRSDGGWGSGIYDMVHCFGLREYGDRLAVRDKESIRVYWIYEAVTEPAFRVPWLGKVLVPEGIGYDYGAVQHGMVEYQGKMYVDDAYKQSVQVFDPSKMEIKYFEDSPINRDTVYTIESFTSAGLTASGKSLFMSVSGSGKINRFDLESETPGETVAEFANRRPGRLELAGDLLYFIDLATGKVVTAQGIVASTAP